jgi:hypothetical protein
VNRRAILLHADKSWQSRTSVTTFALAGAGASACGNVATNSLTHSSTAKASAMFFSIFSAPSILSAPSPAEA